MRVPYWEDRLVEFIDDRAGKAFVWGSNDCATFASDWVRICTGQTLFEADYDDVHGAAAELASRGGMEAAVTAVLGEPLPNPLAAQRGDVGLVETEGRVSLVVVIGADVIGPGEEHMTALPLTALLKAWRVG